MIYQKLLGNNLFHLPTLMISHVTERLSKSCLLSPTALFVNCPEVDDGSMRSVFSVVKENDHLL